MRILNFVLTLAAVLVAALVLTNILMGRSNASTAQRLEQAQALARSTPGNRDALNNLVNRVSQAGATDPALKAVLVKLQLNPPAPAPAAAN